MMKPNLGLTPILNKVAVVVQLVEQSAPGANVIKLFTMVFYCHSIVLLSFCVIKQYYHGNYREWQ